MLEVPAAVGAGLFGTIVDAWQVPLAHMGPSGQDEGKGGKFLLLPPDYKGEIPAGYFPVHSETYNGFAGFRAIAKTEGAEDVAKALGLIKQTRVYPLSSAANPPQQRFVDIYGKVYDGIVRFDDTFFVSLAKMVNQEPVLPRDKEMLGLLLTLGIEKGKDFQSDAATQATLKAAAQAAHGWFMQSLLMYGTQFWARPKMACARIAQRPSDRIQMGYRQLLRRGCSRNRVLQSQYASGEAGSSDFLWLATLR